MLTVDGSTAKAAKGIDPTSCGGLGGPGTEDDFPNCLGANPDTVSIGSGSCTGAGSCFFLSDGTVIGANSCDTQCNNLSGTVGDDSCNGPSACAGAGLFTFNGELEIGDGSCNGEQACLRLGQGGVAKVGDGSCLGLNACADAGWSLSGNSASVKIADNSCHGFGACGGAGFSSVENTGDAIIGSNSCHGVAACQGAGAGLFDNQAQVGSNGMGIIMDASCNGAFACWGAGVGGDACIGSASCNTEATFDATDFPDCRAMTTNVGGCTFNDVTPAQCTAPTSKADCKNGGWMNHGRGDGTAFENQGDCNRFLTKGT